MKAFALIAFLFLTVQARAANIVCTEIESKGSSKIEVEIQELEDITKKVPYGAYYDSIKKVKVHVNEIKRNGFKVPLKSFDAISRAEDVQYGITSVKKNGFLFWMYLDEEDQDGVRLTTRAGKKEVHNLHCVR
jgi:hypothetical protein